MAAATPTAETITSAPTDYAARHTPSVHAHLIVDLPLAAIQPSAENPRTDFNPEELRQLAESLAEHGQIEPIVVRPLVANEVYELIAGERRYRAAQQAGLTHLAAIIREDLDDRGARALRLIENLHRVQLNPVEEAHGFAAMREALGMTEVEIAKLAGRSQPQIAKRLALLRLPPAVQGFVARGTLTQSHANALANLAAFPAVMTRIAELAASQAWPVSALEKIDNAWWQKLQGEKLVRHVGYSDSFRESVCQTCPYQAYRKGHGSYSYDNYCLKPEHYDELQASERRQEEEERAAKLAAAEAKAGEQGVQTMDAMRPSDFVSLSSWQTPPAACTEACPCRSAAIGYNGQVTPICTDPARHRSLQDAQEAARKAEAAALLQRRRDQITETVGLLVTPHSARARAVIAHRVLAKLNPEAARWACQTYGGLTWLKKDKLPGLEALAALDADALLQIALAAVLEDEIVQRRNWGSSPMEALEWFFGPDQGAPVGGVCARCGEAMELTADDLADPQGAVCAECAG